MVVLRLRRPSLTNSGCSGFTADESDSRELFVADSGDCNVGGDTVHIYRFGNDASRDSWIKAASEFGIGRYVVISRGVAYGDDQATADAIKEKIGGMIRT